MQLERRQLASRQSLMRSRPGRSSSARRSSCQPLWWALHVRMPLPCVTAACFVRCCSFVSGQDTLLLLLHRSEGTVTRSVTAQCASSLYCPHASCKPARISSVMGWLASRTRAELLTTLTCCPAQAARCSRRSSGRMCLPSQWCSWMRRPK